MITVLKLGEYPLAVFYADPLTLRTYRPFYSHSLMFSLAYFFNEIWLMLFVFKWEGAYTMQSVAHHCVTIFAGFMVQMVGRALPMTSQCSFLCEFSMFFLGIRTIMGKNATGGLAMVNQFLFFLSYTVFRIVMWPFLMVTMYKSRFTYDFSKESTFHQVAYYGVFSLTIALYGLNWFWYQIILTNVGKVLGLVESKKVSKQE